MAATENPFYSTYIVNCVINAFSSFTAIMLNILTIHAIRKTSSLPKPLKALLLSLAVSDLIVGLVVQPFYIATIVEVSKDKLSFPLATWYGFMTGIFSWVSFFGVVAISIDRLLAIQLHLRYQELVTHKRVVGVVISIWLFSIILSIILWFGQVEFRAPEEISVVVAVVTGLCFICIAIIYCKIYITVRRHTKEINGLQVPLQETRNRELANFARQRKSAVGTFFIYLAFLVCYLPEYCRLLITLLLPESENTIPLLKYFYFSWTLLFLNSSLNPLVYCWKMRNIRRAVMNTIRSIFFKQQDNNSTFYSDDGRSNNVPLAVYSRRNSYSLDFEINVA